MTHKHTRLLALLLVAILALGVAGCGDDNENASTTDDAAMAKDKAMEKADAMKQDAAMKKDEAMEKDEAMKMDKRSTISLGKVSPYGTILQDGRGRTIYLFTKEKTSKSECYDECAEAWPPVTTKSEASAGSGVSESKLGTTKRTDGTTQVTYNDHPLYFYRGETKADQVLCQAVDEFGGIWYVVDKNGDAITKS